MKKVIALALLAFVFVATNAGAASLEETFAAAQAAYKANDFERAGALFSEAGFMLAKKDPAKAGAVWGSAAAVYMKGKMYGRAADTCEQILAVIKKLPQEQGIKVYRTLMTARAQLGQRPLQIAAMDRMLRAYPKLPQDVLADTYARMGDAYKHMELYSPAVTNYDKALYLLKNSPNTEQRGRLLTNLGLCQGNLGDYDKATNSLVEARKLADLTKNPETIAETESNLGVLIWEQGDYPEALEKMKSAISIEEKNNLRRILGADRNNIGLIYKDMGNMNEAMRYIEEALAIAREVKNEKDEGIAMVNRARLHRMAGEWSEAEADFKVAMKLFEKVKFQEGIAGAKVGIGRMIEMRDRNYAAALGYYEEALETYLKLNLVRPYTETLMRIAEVYKKSAAPGRSTRDLSFDDEDEAPATPKITASESLVKARHYAQSALDNAEKISAKTIIWSAHQILGFVDLREKKLEDAQKHYEVAIDIVTKQYLSLEAVQNIGEFMAGKEDLYTEAQEVCFALYEKTKDLKYYALQMKYSETLRNEIAKASAAVLKLNFSDPKKQAMYESLQKKGRQQEKANSTMPAKFSLTKEDKKLDVASQKILADAQKQHQDKVTKLDADYQKLLTEWKTKYGKDANLFESSSRVNIADLQKALKDTDIALHYTSLPEKLVIAVIDRDSVNCFSVEVPRRTIDDMIKNKFLVEYINNGYTKGGRFKTTNDEIKYFPTITKLLNDLYKILIKPVEDSLEAKRGNVEAKYPDKKTHLYVIADGYLAQTPFPALVTSVENGQPTYLVENYDIGSLRPSFIQETLKNAKDARQVKKLLAVANPGNYNFYMGQLAGTIDEIVNVAQDLKTDKSSMDVALEELHATGDITQVDKQATDQRVSTMKAVPERPTEEWFFDKVKSNQYDIIYMATHGQPFSDTYVMYNRIADEKTQCATLKSKQKKSVCQTYQKYLNKPATPLKGFLLLSSEKQEYSDDTESDKSKDGLLTLEEIISRGEVFANTNIIVLSACNTAVTFAPKALVDDGQTQKLMSPKEVEKDLRDNGWIPGLDQVSFVDTFMKQGIRNLYGTFWFADDNSSSFLMSSFMRNLVKQGDKPDAVAAFSAAQREIVVNAKNGKNIIPKCDLPGHPFYWAVGGIFGL